MAFGENKQACKLNPVTRCANLLPAPGREPDRDVRRGADDLRASVRVGFTLGLDQRFQHQEKLFSQHGGAPFSCIPVLSYCRARVSGRLRALGKMVSSIG
jgi:hypothetical protein